MAISALSALTRATASGLSFGLPRQCDRSRFNTAAITTIQAWYFNDNFHVGLGSRSTPACATRSARFSKVFSTLAAVQFSKREGHSSDGIPQNSQPLTPTLLQLFSDRIEFTGQVGLPTSVLPPRTAISRRESAYRGILTMAAYGCPRGYGIFYTFRYEPDQQYRRHDSFCR